MNSVISFRLLHVLTLLIFSFTSVAQKAEADLATRIVLEGGMRMPAIKATSVFTGDVHSLADLKGIDLKYSDKPTLVVAWAKRWCGSVCYRKIDTIIRSGIDKEFNVIALNVEDNELPEGYKGDKLSAPVTLEEVRDIVYERTGWSRIQHYQVNFIQFREAFQKEEEGSTPFFMVLDRNQRIVNTFKGYGLPVQRFADLLSDLNSELVSASAATQYFDSKSMLTTKENAYYYIVKSKQTNGVMLKTYYAKGNRLFSQVTYTNEKGLFLRDGIFKTFYDDDMPADDLYYNNGQLLRGKYWFKNGELKAEISTPLNGPGFSKSWREDGTMELQATFMNGLMHGIARRYDEKGRPLMEANFEGGKLNGVYKTYKDGILVSEAVYKDDAMVKEREVEN